MAVRKQRISRGRGQHYRWPTPVILATQEAEISLKPVSGKKFMRPYLGGKKKITIKRLVGLAEWLASMIT
jgi:hypothetical protein